MDLLNNYIPNGSSGSKGISHVLVTSRVMLPGFDEKVRYPWVALALKNR